MSAHVDLEALESAFQLQTSPAHVAQDRTQQFECIGFIDWRTGLAHWHSVDQHQPRLHGFFRPLARRQQPPSHQRTVQPHAHVSPINPVIDDIILGKHQSVVILNACGTLFREECSTHTPTRSLAW